MTTLSVIGLGKLGSPMAAVYAAQGFEVIGVDKNDTFIKAINEGRAPVDEPQLQEYLDRAKGKIRATHSIEDAVKNSDVTFVIVPTPSGPTGAFKNDFVLQAIKEIGDAIRSKETYHLVVITSTVMPGSTGGIIAETLTNHANKPLGDQLGLCYSPEFIALGSVVNDLLNPDFLLIGQSDDRAGLLLQEVYQTICPKDIPVSRMNLVNAELSKISVNTYVTTKISYANMISDICDHLKEADASVVLKAIGNDHRIGHLYLKPGLGYGGPCFPRDNVAFATLCSQYNVPGNIPVATDDINRHQNQRLLNKLNHLGVKKVGILGLSYKPNTPVIEESPAIDLARRLPAQSVCVYDPMAMPPAQSILQDHVHYASSMQECIDFSDAIIIMTAWDEFKTINDENLKDKKEMFPIFDCWRLFDQDFFDKALIIYPGKHMNLQNGLKGADAHATKLSKAI